MCICACSCASVCYGSIHTKTKSTCSCAQTASFDRIINEIRCKIPSDLGQLTVCTCVHTDDNVTVIILLHMLPVTYFTKFKSSCKHRMKTNLRTILLSSNESKCGNHSEYYATQNPNWNSETNIGTQERHSRCHQQLPAESSKPASVEMELRSCTVVNTNSLWKRYQKAQVTSSTEIVGRQATCAGQRRHSRRSDLLWNALHSAWFPTCCCRHQRRMYLQCRHQFPTLAPGSPVPSAELLLPPVCPNMQNRNVTCHMLLQKMLYCNTSKYTVPVQLIK